MKRTVGVVALVIGGLLLGGCSSTPSTPSQKVQSWNQQLGLPAIDAQINSDLDYLRSATKSGNLDQLQTDCNGFPGDVEALYETLPSPDTELTNELNDATQSWFSAARQCVDATGIHTAKYRTYLKDMASASRSYEAAKKRFAFFGVR